MIKLSLINSLIVILAVLVHYEFLSKLAFWMLKTSLPNRFRIVIGVLGALCAHAVEVWIFAIAYYVMYKADGWGTLIGNFDGSLADCVYFSFTTFTTLGFGDIEPLGDLKYLTGLESLTGLVLVTWTASFLFIEMQRFWDKPS